MSAQFGPEYSPRDLAGFTRRTLALVFDAALLIGALFAVSAARMLLGDGPEFQKWPIIAWVLASAVYLIGLRLTEGGTLGYRICGIRYAYMFEGRPNVWWRLSRALWAVFLLASFGLDHFWIIFDPNKQSWHDKVSGFYVVRRAARPTGSQRVVQRVITFAGANFVVWEPAKSRVG